MVEQSIVTDALDNLRVHQRKLDADGCEVGVSRQALNDVIIYVGRLMGELAALKHDIERQVEVNAELATENERLRETLSRTGAVKVKALEWVKHPVADAWRADTMLGTYQVWVGSAATAWQFDSLLGERINKPANDSDEAKAAAQADYERRILSALELVEPEGGQEAAADAVQFLYKHGDLTHSAAHRSVKLLTDNGFVIYRRPA